MRSLYSQLVSYWNLQDQSGSRLDLVGVGNTLTNTNTVTSVDGFLGQASNFVAASSQRLSIASNTSIQGGPKNYTWTFWVQLASKPANAMSIISKYSATAGQAEYIVAWLNTSDRFVTNVYRATDSLNQVVGNNFGAPSTGVWVFICAWYDNDAPSVNIEINAGATDTTSMGGTAQAASTASMAFGSLGVTGTQYLDGKMAEVGRWDRILTRQERVWLYNNGRGRTFPFMNGPYSLARHYRNRRLNSGLFMP